MEQMEREQLTQNIIEEAILIARNEHIPNWQDRIDQMGRRVTHIHELVKQQPIVPTELQDAYRAEIDNLTLENTTLKSQLELTRAALTRAKDAWKSERHQNHTLQSKLETLEKRLLGLLHNRQDHRD